MGLQDGVTAQGKAQVADRTAAEEEAAKAASATAGSSTQGKAESGLQSATSGYQAISDYGSSLASQASAFSGVNDALASEALDYDPQWLVDQAATDVRLSYDKAQGIMERNMSRYGINPNTGSFVGKQDDWARALAAAEAGAKTKGARDAYGDRLDALTSAAGVGQGFVNAATSAMSTGAGGLQSVAGDYGSIAGSEAELAAYNQQQATNDSMQSQIDALVGNGPGGQGDMGVYDENTNSVVYEEEGS